MQREAVLEKWARMLYYWSMGAGVDIGAITTEDIPEWEDYPSSKQRPFRDIAEKLWEEVG